VLEALLVDGDCLLEFRGVHLEGEKVRDEEFRAWRDAGGGARREERVGFGERPEDGALRNAP
jgi:hypothetical protein